MNCWTRYKAQKLEAMHNIMLYISDEDYYYAWIYLIPDGATKEDFIEIAEDDEELYKEAEELFKKLITKAIRRDEF